MGVSDSVKRLINSFVTSSMWALGPLCATGLWQRSCHGLCVFQRVWGLGIDRGLNKQGAVTDETQEGKKKKDQENGQASLKEAGVREEDTLTHRKNGMLVHFKEWGYKWFTRDVRILFKHNPTQIITQWMAASNTMNCPSFCRPVACAETDTSKEK